MLSNRTERKLFELFNFVANKEAEIELQRQKLAKVNSFDPFQAFKYIAQIGDCIVHSDI